MKAAAAALALGLGAMLPMPSAASESGAVSELTPAGYLCIVDDEPDTLDPQCTTSFYHIPLNVFDRLVEVKAADGESHLVPSLAESWEISPDGRTYTFHLRPGVCFSNGSALTASDVGYTLRRLLTWPQSHNQDLAMSIEGAEELRLGEAETLAGFRELDDLTFEITLAYPFAPFLACLSTPGASILDAESTEAAGEEFGQSAELTVGTGPFMLTDWQPGNEIRMAANPRWWDDGRVCAGLRMLFLSETVSQRMLYEEGVLDILDLEYLGPEAEYFVHGDIYRANLAQGPRVGITYIALNERVAPLSDVRVRRALQLALDRELLMKAIVSGRGSVENGIFPHGLMGFNPDLPEIPCDPEAARALLEAAGLPDGFELEITTTQSSAAKDHNLLEIIAYMWGEIGVKTRIVTLDGDEFMNLRKQGKVACYTSTWSADYNDPDNFIYTFFGTPGNTLSRSLCYSNGDIMRRVVNARAIVDESARLAEYQALEQKIVQEDAAWIPLYSRQHLFVVKDRVKGFQVSWNGWSSSSYRNVTIAD